ncbi:hypothetical protein CBR64_20735 [Cellulosimicrobium cellulans]|uniref:Restriction endonuclease n=1 Tax=Cellulosimicrobium cellulans TaxID=1710 RepID=A0A1Y0I3K4_CELCE|nr:hypothetical protein CBR64_20735 [Cellulosimicrobium cellulans]
MEAAGDKPPLSAPAPDKKNYAQRLSNGLAQLIADALRPTFPDITPDPAGRSQEARVRTATGQKRLDVKVTDPTLGLLLSVSIKTLSFRDVGTKRYTKNVVRNDHELRGEAAVLHQRQPYSVVIGVLFTPVDAATDGRYRKDGSVSTKSSFAHMVDTFRKRTGRGKRPILGLHEEAYVNLGGEDVRFDLCERMFLGLYESEGSRRGLVRFVDVEKAVPQKGVPSESQTLSFDEFIAAVAREVEIRNESAPSWSDDPSDED